MTDVDRLLTVLTAGLTFDERVDYMKSIGMSSAEREAYFERRAKRLLERVFGPDPDEWP